MTIFYVKEEEESTSKRSPKRNGASKRLHLIGNKQIEGVLNDIINSVACGDNVHDESLLFEDDDDEEEESVLKTTVEKTTESKRKKHIWTEHSKWDSLDAVDDYLTAEGFVLFDDQDLKMGQKFYYRCSRIPKDRKREEWCARRFIVFLPSDSNEIILQTNSSDHDHHILLKGKKIYFLRIDIIHS